MSDPSWPPPPPAPSPRRRDRPVALVVAVFCLVGAILALVGAVLLFGQDEPSSADADDPRTSGSAVAVPEPTRSQDAPSEGTDGDDGNDGKGHGTGKGNGKGKRDPGPTGPTGPVTDAAAEYRCWDGDYAASRSACSTQPTGIRGLHWVFPGSDGCDRRPASGRVTYTECTVTASSGGAVEVHYSEWSSAEAGRKHYRRGQVRRAVRWRGMLRWDLRAQAGNHRFKTALMYPRSPWSVTVYGGSDADRDEVLERVQWRAPRNLRGTSLR